MSPRAALAQIRHTSFQGETREYNAFAGRRVALLLDPKRVVDGATLKRVLDAIDRAWEWYFGFFGEAPRSAFSFSGRTTIAEVEKTCGAGCGRLGHTGIELWPDIMTALLTHAKDNLWDQTPFYELGRNFWFFGDQLGHMDAFITGFAHVHRFLAMDASSLKGATWNGFDFNVYRNGMLMELLQAYEADRTLTWETTFAAGKCPPNKYGWTTADFLGAAFFNKMFRDHGATKYREFWRQMRTAPRAHNARESAERYVQVAFRATGQDYRGLLKDPSLPIDASPEPRALRLYWNERRRDNFTGATEDAAKHAHGGGYTSGRTEGYIWPRPQPGMIPLQLYWHERWQDNFTTASAGGHAYAKANGYQLARTEGYVHAKPVPGTTPLHLYRRPDGRDNFTTATSIGQEHAKPAGYKHIGIEGYIRPA